MAINFADRLYNQIRTEESKWSTLWTVYICNHKNIFQRYGDITLCINLKIAVCVSGSLETNCTPRFDYDAK